MAKKVEECFVIMPISDPKGYEDGHFKHVYDDIVSKACEIAGYKPIRADDVNETNLIHADILRKIIDTPMAVCDLSNRNPNVLFELGIRQAFDKPVVLIQERGTLPIFDISILRYTEYHKERIYHNVLDDQQKIAIAITATKKATENGDGLNSIITLLSLTSPAEIKDFQQIESNPMMQLIMAEISSLKKEIKFASSISINSEDYVDGLHGDITIIKASITNATFFINNENNRNIHNLRKAVSICEKAYVKAENLLSNKNAKFLSSRMYDDVNELRILIVGLRQTAISLIRELEEVGGTK